MKFVKAIIVTAISAGQTSISEYPGLTQLAVSPPYPTRGKGADPGEGSPGIMDPAPEKGRHQS